METTRPSWILPGAILAAGAILAIAIYVVRADSPVFGPREGNPTLMRPVHPNEHIVGNPEARIKIVEYADLDSAYAKEFQSTLSQIMLEYGSTGNVAWVFRHFPLVNQNIYAARHAEASECVASLGGNAAFWKFLDMVNATAPSDTQLSPEDYDTLVRQLGISEESFNACVASGEFASEVEEDFADALAAGAIASPYSIVLIEGKNPIPINGSVPYATVKRIIDTSL